MTTENHNPKQIHFKAYEHLSLLENTLKIIKEQEPTGLQISILGKMVQFYHDKDISISTEGETIKRYWDKNLNNTNEFGSIYNQEIGNLFIVGALTSTFLNKVDGKTLGMLSVGPYGILRGIGASETQANTYLKLLKSGSYLLILRGVEDELENLKKILAEKEEA